MIRHDWILEKKMHLILSACVALPPGGALLAITGKYSGVIPSEAESS
jgi:hypothetical protein